MSEHEAYLKESIASLNKTYRQLWIARLNESLPLLDKCIGKACECHRSWPKGTICIQCHARNVQGTIRENGEIPTILIQDAVEQVICHIDDTGKVTISPDHELECIRYWATA